MATAIIVFAEGFEETEAVATADVLRRAGVDLELVGLAADTVTGDHGITLTMDRTLQESEDVDAVILPGGLPGAQALGDSDKLADVLTAQRDAGKIVAAICASPGCVLARRGLLEGKRATGYPGFEDRFPESATYVKSEDVVVDGNLVTSRGPGTALKFGLKLAELLVGQPTAGKLADGMLVT